MLPKNFSSNLYALRHKNGLSQEEFAEKINVSRQAVSKWERNEAYPDIENLLAISELFGISLDTLVSGSVEEVTVPVEVPGRDDDNDNDKDNDDDDDDDDDDAYVNTNIRIRIWYDLPYPILITIAYLLWGFLGNGWDIGWTLYITIPVFYSIIDCIRHKKVSDFCYPVFITFVYLLMGMAFGMWHPWWVLFITVPVFYVIAYNIDKSK